MGLRSIGGRHNGLVKMRQAWLRWFSAYMRNRWKLLLAAFLGLLATALIPVMAAWIVIATYSISPMVVSWMKTQYPGKSKWDYLEKILIPIASPLAIAFGVWYLEKSLKDRDVIRGEKEAEERERVRTEENKSQALQLYFDRISDLLIEKQIIGLTIAAKKLGKNYKDPLVESARAVIRAQTLAILRVFSEDVEKKSAVMRFLIETEILASLAVSLRDANLRNVNLRNANLQGVDLKGVDLRDADLTRADFRDADLTRAQLENATILFADFEHATLVSANLRGVKKGTTFPRAILLGAYLQGADLTNAMLEHANLQGVVWDALTLWPPEAFFRAATNIPPELKSQLDL